ncbi:hypothetical protein FRC05_009304 [Tulasnella sp. 425]|nr:hypothetical protein FRC05_009304 [Tulasnella sp. 425]
MIWALLKPNNITKKQKNASAQNPSKPPQERKKTSNTQSVNEATSVTDKKAVYRPVLDNPLKIEWPNIPLNVENNILALVVQLLETVRPYHEQRSEMSREGKKSRRAHNYKRKTGGRIDKKGKTVQVSEEGSVVVEPTREDATVLTRKRKRGTSAEEEGDESEEESVLPPSKKRKPDEESELQTGTAPLAPARPEMLDHVVFGLNAVTKRLEAQSFGLRSALNSILPSASATSGSPHTSQIAHSEGDRLEKVAPLRLVLVCRTDIDSPTMITHLPTLTAACNSVRLPHTEMQQSIPNVLLVGLPSGAESTLAESSGLWRAAVVAFDTETPELEERLAPFLPSVPILRAHWLTIAPIAPALGSTLKPSTFKI